MSQKIFPKPMAGPQLILLGRLPRAHQVAHRLMFCIGNPHRSVFTRFPALDGTSVGAITTQGIASFVSCQSSA
jgi:hypothetical protein